MDSSNIFYISSWGGSATQWISTVLSLHPQIDCFHGSRKAPGQEENPHSPELSETSYVQALKATVKEENFIGGCHGFHGVNIKAYIEKEGGVFCGILRDPIMRIQSLFKCHTEENDPNKIPFDFWAYTYQEYQNASLIQAIEEEGGAKITLEDLVFTWVAYQTLVCDCHMFITGSKVFRMEDLTESRDHMTQFVNHLTQGRIETTESYLSQVFSTRKINSHSHQTNDPKDTFDAWNSVQQSAFKIILRSINSPVHQPLELTDFYRQRGYDLNFIEKSPAPATSGV